MVELVAGYSWMCNLVGVLWFDIPSSFKSRLIDACVICGPSVEMRKNKEPHGRYLMAIANIEICDY